ncbi:MAG TPA: M20/M25/M40 family metallo-hydrolase [Thermoanaerobaculaceae bacterium]|nr:M20/M25/M40 family metallo-hydrolase [Thermoanaerobaculaceae bacterium]HRS16182.1 M20/M25/M40 family metallo-hydrolase [Thermoanaerobaculaceae bacterium]
MRKLAPQFALLVAAVALAQDPAGDFLKAGSVEPLPAPVQARLEAITADALAAHVGFLAAPAQEGRGLGSRGLEAAAEYVVAQLRLAGVRPFVPAREGAAESGFFQAVPLREVRGLSGTLTVETRTPDGVQSRTFSPGVDLVLPQLGPRSLGGGVVFAGYGIREPGLGRDDFAALDVRGKVVLILGGLPPGEAWQKPELVERYGSTRASRRYAAKLKALRRLGASLVLAAEGQDLTARLLREEAPPERVFLPYDPIPYPDDEPPLVPVSSVVADSLLAAAGLSFATAPAAAARELVGATATLRITGTETLVSSRNVIGMLPGSDPSLEDMAVVVGAHMDHLGTVGDKVYAGADDNASGVAALLEIARAFAGLEPAPKRTVIFAFWTGEEDGKLGSGHWVRHPLWQLARTSAYLNLDMIGHPWLAEEISTLLADAGHPDPEGFLAGLAPEDFVEPGLPPDRPELAAALLRAGRATGLALHLDRTDGTHGGSDYRDFARAGVPWVRFFGNFFPDYHEPGDTPNRLDPAQVRRVARLAFATAYTLADR